MSIKKTKNIQILLRVLPGLSSQQKKYLIFKGFFVGVVRGWCGAWLVRMIDGFMFLEIRIYGGGGGSFKQERWLIYLCNKDLCADWMPDRGRA